MQKHSVFKYKISFTDLAYMLLLSAVFFALPVFTAPDSAAYINNAYVFAGQMPPEAWNSMRGPTLPFLLRISFGLFGESTYGTAVMLYIFYAAFVALTLYSCYLLGLTEKLGKGLCWFLCSALLFLNPTVLTYAHHVLTEFFALVFASAAFCLVLKTQKLMQKEKPKKAWAVLLVRYLGTAVLVVALYALKQMFFVIPLILLGVSEIILLCGRFGAKRLIASVIAVVLVAACVPFWGNIWGGAFGGSAGEDEMYSTNSLATSTLIDGLRYFRPQQRGTQGVPVQIDVMENGYEEIRESFTYTFDGSIAGSLDYMLTCFKRSPERFISGWMHNYLVISNVRRVINYESRAYCPVTVTNNFFQSFETQSWLERYKELEKGILVYEEGHSGEFDQFAQPVDSGLASNLLFNTKYPVFSYFIYSFVCFLAPWLLLFAVIMLIILRKKPLFHVFWQNVALLSGGVFGYIFFLAVTAANIDRYGFPSTGFCALLLLYICAGILAPVAQILRQIWQRKREKAQVNGWYKNAFGL